MSNLFWDFGSAEQRAVPARLELAILSPKFFEVYRLAQATALDDIPQERIGLKARIDEANGAFTYEDPWVRMTLRPNASHYELQIIGFHKQVSRISTSTCPEIATPGQAIEALKLEVRDYWTSPLHMLPNAPPQVLKLFAPFESKYRLRQEPPVN